MGLFDAISNSFSGTDSDGVWETISDTSRYQAIVQKSEERPQLIYKHSNRCSVCFVAKGSLEKAADDIREHADMHYLDVVKNRKVSNAVASELNVRHESPQVIVINGGEVVWHASHGQIKSENIIEVLQGVC